MKQLRPVLILLLTIVSLLLAAGPARAADYSNSNLMDDLVFDDVNSMGSTTQPDASTPSPAENAIQAFLASKGPCLANYNDVEPIWNGSQWSYVGSVRSSRIITDAARQWGLNPQVIIATLQKEESLITGTSCDSWRYNSAMGYGCPDSGGCNPKYAGLTRQILWGSWQLKFSKERAYGNTAWDGDGDITYVGYMTAGDRKRCDTCATFTYDGNISVDGQTIHINNGATAALYTYTPHLGQSFPGIFESWFGPVIAQPYDVLSVIGPPSAILPNQSYNSTVSVRNNTGKTWYSDGNVPSGQHPTRLATLSYGSSPFANTADPAWLGTSNQVRMVEPSVASGQNATFNFTMRGPFAATAYVTRFTVVVDGVGFLRDMGIAMSNSTPAPIYSYQLVGATNPPSVMLRTQSASASLTIKNTGNVVWRNESTKLGGRSTRLITSRPAYRSSSFFDSPTWLAPSQIGMQTGVVNPGESGQFNFNWKAPSVSGNYQDNFIIGIDGVALMSDNGMAFSTFVGDYYKYSFVSGAILDSQILPGDSVSNSITVRNDGNVPWYADGSVPAGEHPMRLARVGYARSSYTDPTDSAWLGTSNQIKMSTAKVNPGENAVFNFKMAAPFQQLDVLEGYTLVLDGVNFLPYSGPSLHLRTPAPLYGYQLVGATNPPSTMSLGQTASVSLTIRNTGNVVWQSESSKPFGIGSARIVMANPVYRNSAFYNSSDSAWLGTKNQFSLSTQKVMPGQNAVFTAIWKAPAAAGLYIEPFTVVLDGLQILPYAGMRFDIQVQ